MRTVYHAEHLADAYLVKGLLEAIDIPAFVPGEFLVGAMGELPVSGLVLVAVPTMVWKDARAALDGWIAEGLLRGSGLPDALEPPGAADGVLA